MFTYAFFVVEQPSYLSANVRELNEVCSLDNRLYGGANAFGKLRDQIERNNKEIFVGVHRAAAVEVRIVGDIGLVEYDLL